MMANLIASTIIVDRGVIVNCTMHSRSVLSGSLFKNFKSCITVYITLDTGFNAKLNDQT